MIHNPKDDKPNAPKPEDEHAHEALAAFGLHAEGPLSYRKDDAPGEFYLWPEHLQAFRIFDDCSTQWRSSMEAREGLDYHGVEIVMRQHSGRRSGFRWKDHTRLLREVQAMESGALSAWADERAKHVSRTQ